VRTASTGRTIGRRALPAGMLSRGIDASAKIASPAGGDASRPRCLKTGSTGWAQSADREISEDDSAAGWISRSYHPRRPRRGGRRRDANRGGGLTGTVL